MKPSKMATATALLLALLAACDELDDPSTVKDLRLLAVTVDQPEIILDPADTTTPLPEIAVSALVADPAGAGRRLSWSIRACTNDPQAPSAPGAGTEAAGNYPGGGARQTVGSSRCPSEGITTAQLMPHAPFDGRPAQVRLGRDLLAAGLLTDVFLGHRGQPHGGFDLGLPINLEIAVQAEDEVVVGVKRVIFWPAPLAPNQIPNRNPEIADLRTFTARDPHTLEPQQPILPLDPAVVSLLAGQAVWIEPVGAQAEPYLTTVIDRLSDQAKVVEVPAETLRFSFFASAGKFVPAETTSTLPFGVVATARIPLEARYEPPGDSGLTLDQVSNERSLWVTIWVVVRDERGGASYTQRRLRIRASGQ